jgi:molecular chaperone Hsp33
LEKKLPSRDTLQRFLFEHTAVRGEIVQLGASWRTVLTRHDYPPGVRRLLGEMMAATALLSATLKFSGSITMQIRGNGPVSLLVAECSAALEMRAVAKWEEPIEDGATLPELAGDGRFVIILDPGEGKKPYQGIVAVEGDSVAAALEHYMARSEQLQTRLFLAADGRMAAGMLLQKLPGVQEADLDAWNRAVQLGSTLNAQELLELPGGEIIRRLYHGEDVRLFDAVPVSFRCTCSLERVSAMLRMLGRDEVMAALDEHGKVDVQCEFCNQHYGFDEIDITQLFIAGLAAAVVPGGASRH